MTGIYSALFPYRERARRSPFEDFLTEALCDLLNRCPPATSKEFVAQVLITDHHIRTLWRTAASEMHRLIWQTQVVIQDNHGYWRPDIVLEADVDGAPKRVLIVENKISARIQQHGLPREVKIAARDRSTLSDEDEGTDQESEIRNQLQCYGEWLENQDKPDGWNGGLTLLTHFTEAPDDFLDPKTTRYGSGYRSVASWSRIYKWLLGHDAGVRGKHHISMLPESAVTVLAKEFALFLKENNMANEQVVPSDIAATGIFVGSADRIFNTFQAAYKEFQPTIENIKDTQRHWGGDYEFDARGRLLWEWIFLNRKYAPASYSWYVAWGIRFPDYSGCWTDANPRLPVIEHVFVNFASEKPRNLIPLKLLDQKDRPKGWSISVKAWSGVVEHESKELPELVVGSPVVDFLQRPEEFGQMFGRWVNQRVIELEKFLSNHRSEKWFTK